MDEYLKTAISAAKKGGKIFTKHFGKAGRVENKEHDFRNPVTEIDRSIETNIRKIITKKFPGHKIIGEEYAQDKVGQGDTVWIIDPIDGTSNYVHGLPFCCISIAVWDGRGPAAAVVYNPQTDYLFSGIRGQGAFLNNARIRVSLNKSSDKFFIGYGWGHNQNTQSANLMPKLTNIFGKVRCMGATALDACMVAKATYDAHIQLKCSIWDIAAAALIVTEAGGKITDLSGLPINLKTTKFVASNGKIHSQLLKILK